MKEILCRPAVKRQEIPPSAAEAFDQIAQLNGISSDFTLHPCARAAPWDTTPSSARSDSLQDALCRGRKLMGKPVRFRRGIATVIPDCASGTVSQITSRRGFSDVCDIQTSKQKPCYTN